VSGANFGSGSSREQAATCLKHSGIQLVIAKSFSETYKRNALNNSLLCLESREFVHQLQLFVSKAFPTAPSDQKTFRTGVRVRLSFADGQLEVLSDGGKGGAGRVFQVGSGMAHYKIPAVGRVAQELLVAGGLEPWIRQQINIK
jgi:homoaconitate hydratase